MMVSAFIPILFTQHRCLYLASFESQLPIQHTTRNPSDVRTVKPRAKHPSNNLLNGALPFLVGNSGKLIWITCFTHYGALI